MFRSNAIWKNAAFGLAGLMLAASAQAELAVDVLSATTYMRGSWANFGYSFNTTDALRVDALGLWDFQGNGLDEAHEVGLWDNAGNLLAQATVSNASSVVASANANHAWRFTAIAPIDLAPGEYKLGAFYPTTADWFVASGPTPVDMVLAPQISFGSSYVTTGGTEFFTEPTTTTSFSPGFFGPNASFSPVPEPATLFALALGALMMARRR